MAAVPNGHLYLYAIQRMSERSSDFAELMRNVQVGSQEAVRELLRSFGPVIKREVRKRLNSKLRPKFDSADFVQTVWLSFFASCKKECRFHEPRQLAAFLAAIARNKVGDEFRRRLQTVKHGIAREQRINDSDLPLADELCAAEPTPSQVAIAREKWDRILEGQPPHYQEILRLRYQGFTFLEISEQLELHERTVRRVVRKILRDTTK